MDADEFRRRGKEMIDFIADYIEKDVKNSSPIPQVQPGYLKPLLPQEAPVEAESYDDLMEDFKRLIMPGMSKFMHPGNHSFFSISSSYEATLAELLTNGMCCIPFTWAVSPAATELEVITTDWLGKMLQLPEQFLSGGKGGGVIQGGASMATLVCLLAARSQKVTVLTENEHDTPSMTKAEVMGKLVAYCSDQSHSSVERACLLGAVHCHLVETDEADEMRGDALKAAIAEDKTKGLIPFFVVATLGTTSSCSFDNITEIGPICCSEGLWFHIDAAYAGSSFICPEFRPLLNGIEYVDSLVVCPYKWMLVNYDCSVLWLKDSSVVTDAFTVDHIYFRYTTQNKMPEYMSVELAHEFEELVKGDHRFTITHKVTMALVCFRLKEQPNSVNQELLERVNSDGSIHIVPSQSKGRYFLRFSICAYKSGSADVWKAWRVISEKATLILSRN